MYHKILLAADGSEHANRAAEHAMELAKMNVNSQVDIVYVVDHDKVKSDVLANWNSADMSDKRKVQIKKIERMAKAANIKYEIVFLHGEPGPQIVSHANDNKFDVVVIGSRGLNGLQEFVLGSVSHKVAKRANCPVMIVK
ncbi:universal stress protein [Oceanobacillus halophilus]|uniref:Universal stress protein n=1 Tax=Oceanobacillus halophilus TaxID=930130 RepID=A0A495A8J9_9BACI|nr:universal stress protein [Oceanobacillus halophilus]RKQ35691.1 universal stress protein [Oceanobacillus halophilus]